ncbi:autotransporter outer membrane beta-barrel domain-containing protein, partial [Mangrovibacter yixingensis]|uniref:autotransporter outer membrane beta-barrel domain-containing protein n=1 Tax=Mangrovibacter yixingensis TaxID=1529639 RepID=UPI001CFC4A08
FVHLQSSLMHNMADSLLDIVSVLDSRSTNIYSEDGGYIGSRTGLYGVAVLNNSSFINDGTVQVSGQGAHGVAVGNNSQAVNNGLITLNSMSNDLDEDGNLLTETGLHLTAQNFRRGTAMLVNGGGARAVNAAGGEIRVHNAGMGMVANDGTALNQGTITLTVDNDNTDGLYAMAAVGSGIAINDTTGVININTDLGQAFYTEGNGQVFNFGTVNFYGSPINNGDPNWGASTSESDYVILTTPVLTAEGENGSWSDESRPWLLLQDTANYGDATFDSAQELYINSVLVNHEGATINARLSGMGSASQFVNRGTVTATEPGSAVIKNLTTWNEGLITNIGPAVSGEVNALWNSTRSGADVYLYNSGEMIATGGYSAISTSGGNATSNGGWIYNLEGGRIYGENPLAALVNLGRPYNFHNAGEVTVKGDGAVAIRTGTGGYTTRVVNDGVINVGTQEGREDGTNGEGLVGIQAPGDANIVNNTANGVINVWADNSWAFEKTSSKSVLINNGSVVLHGTGGGIIKDSEDDGRGDDDDLSVPNPPSVPEWNSNASLVNNYVIGTNADGTAGKLGGNNLHIDSTVTISAGFTAGTAAKEVTFSNVFTGNSISGAENIGSQTVVWNAQGYNNADGNVDVTMTKNDYVAVISDQSVAGVAAALDNGYTSNSLYSSLNVSTSAELDRALKQVSGVQATGLNKEARILGQRFTRLAAESPVATDSGLSFNVVAKGDKRAEMANKVTYDMVAVGQRFDSGFGELEAHYGMARLSGSGGNAMSRAGDNGLTGGYSQFFGLGHHLSLGDGLGWHNSLRYDRHQLDSRRDIRFEGVRNSARSDVHIQQLALRSEGAKTLNLGDSLSVKPFAGVAVRHQMTGGMQERGAGDFNLSMSRYTETAVDAVTGLRLNWAGESGWGAHAHLEAGPNLAFSRQGRTASLAGASGQQFRVEDGKRGGGVNSQATAGTNYRQGNLDIGANAFHWREDGAQDKGFLLNLTRYF